MVVSSVVGPSAPTLPVRGGFAVLVPKAAEQAPFRPGILVVDDEPGQRQALSGLLLHAGFHVLLAVDGLEAVDVYRRHGLNIDLVLVDADLLGLDGRHTLSALRQLDPLMRCCYLTDEPNPTAAAQLVQQGVERVFARSSPAGELTRCLWQLIGQVWNQRN
jgi:CheY-like chemotaxis protein